MEYQSLTTIYFQVQFLIIEVPFEISRYLLTNFLEGNRCQQNVKTCNKNYYQRDKEKFKANYIGKCKLNKERKQYYQLSEGKAKEYSRANYQSNIETIKEKKKAFYQELKENKAKKQIKKNIVTNFKKSIQEGPFYICVSCHRCLYHVSVIKFVKERYYIEVFSVAITSFDGNLYICKTCDLQLLKKRKHLASLS